jgi:ABC-type glycerol-3-phosphate transport system substrate-binding protein
VDTAARLRAVSGRGDALAWARRHPWRSLAAVISLLVVLALAVAGCGGGDGDGGADAGSAGDLADLSGQTVTVAAVWTGAEQQSFQAVLDEFSRRTGATTRYTPTGDDIAAFIGGRVAGGDPPDVLVVPQPGLIADLAGQGTLGELPADTVRLVEENYSPDWVDVVSVDGTLYGVPFKAANKSTVWFNVPALEAAGVEAPGDWDAFRAGLGTIRASGTTPLSVGGADGWTLTDWFENVYLRTAGPENYDRLVAHEIPWTDASVKDALTLLGQIWTDQNLAGGRSGALRTDFPASVTNTFGDPSRSAIVYEGDFVARVITSETDAELQATADFFDFPTIRGSAPSVVGGGDFPVLTTDSDGGKELLRFLAGPEAAEIWAARGGFASANRNIDTGVYPDDISRRSAGALVNAETFRFDGSDLMPTAFGGTPGQGLWKCLQDFLRSGDVDATAQRCEDAAVPAYRRDPG